MTMEHPLPAIPGNPDDSVQIRESEIWAFTPKTSVPLPLFLNDVPAGFPSPAEDYIDKSLDLNEYLIRNPAATFFVRAIGDSMKDAGIHSGDILIVDRALEPRTNSIIVAVLNNELTVKRVRQQGDKLFLIPENSEFEIVEVTPEMDFTVWGVVTNVIHNVE